MLMIFSSFAVSVSMCAADNFDFQVVLDENTV